MLNELELGDKKPSQLLREMRRLAGNKATEDVLRIKWIALLPTHFQSVLKIFTSNALAKLEVAADKLMESPISPVAFTGGRSSPSHITPLGIQAVQPNREEEDTKYLLDGSSQSQERFSPRFRPQLNTMVAAEAAAPPGSKEEGRRHQSAQVQEDSAGITIASVQQPSAACSHAPSGSLGQADSRETPRAAFSSQSKWQLELTHQKPAREPSPRF